MDLNRIKTHFLFFIGVLILVVLFFSPFHNILFPSNAEGT